VGPWNRDRHPDVVDVEELAERIAAADADLLSRLTPDQRDAQRTARSALYDYFVMLAEDSKRRGHDAVYNDLSGVANFLGGLEAAADTAAHESGDVDEAGDFRYDPDEAEEREHARIEARDEWLSGATLVELEAARGTVAPDDLPTLEDMIVYRRANPN
jgi:hypothetical protein